MIADAAGALFLNQGGYGWSVRRNADFAREFSDKFGFKSFREK